MKRLLITSMMMIAATVDQLAAQGVVTINTGGAVQSPASVLGTVVVQQVRDAAPAMVISNPRRWGLRGSRGRHGDRAFGDWGYAPDPYFYPEEYDDLYPVPPTFIVVTTLTRQADAPAQATPAPAKSEMREYNWPSSGSDSSKTTYSIVSRDGQVEFATAVWVQGNEIGYYRPDHSTGRMTVDSIDSQATRQRNAEQKLLWLPSESQTDSYLAAGRQ
jgi:hypothetical protein